MFAWNGKDKYPEKYTAISRSTNNLSMSVNVSEINTVPMSVLKRMFQKAWSLVKNDRFALK